MIVHLQGGLGNQMFQYAYGRAQTIESGEPLYFDLSLLASGQPPRKLGLDAYVPVEVAPDGMKGERLNGYWQNERYFHPSIRREFAKPLGQPSKEVMALAGRIFGTWNATFIGVRRADYLWPERLAFHGVMPADYYQMAVAMLPRSKFFVFTDDVEWAKANVPGEVVSSGEPHWDIWLMSLCQNAIIANSTFHWWGAYLGPDRRGTVIAPKNWFVQESSDIAPERWTVL